jgi:nicotinate-nucleotide adenylyltransferase
VSVAHEAHKLAQNYNTDTYKAYLAGLLHDCAKEIENPLSSCNFYNIDINKILIYSKSLIHSFLGAEIAHELFDIDDIEILNAIRYHTTGRANMSLLEKIIYVADKIEARRSFNGVNVLRKNAYKDLDRTLAISLKFTIKRLNYRNLFVDELSIEAYDFYKSSMFDSNN